MNDQTFDVFVSYAHSDGEFVATLLSRLEDENIHAFADRSIKPGDDWLLRLEAALKESQVILFLITPNSLRSNWVNAEAGAAWILKKRVIPVLLDADPSQLFDLLRTHQAHNLHNPQRIDDLITYLRDVINPPPPPTTSSKPAEVFTAPTHWRRLLRIGDWSRNEKTDEIAGTGMHTYLLSNCEHGPTFSLTARFVIRDAHPINRVDAINAGIVLGWTTPCNVRRYFDLVMTGDRLLLELVGGRGGDAYGDYRHINDGVEFRLLEDVPYTFRITAQAMQLHVTVMTDHGCVEYSTELPEPLVGRVGIRPWRSTLVCSQFDVITE
jgi:hypothetical protein